MIIVVGEALLDVRAEPTARLGFLLESFEASTAAGQRTGRLTPDMLGARSSGVVVHPSSGRLARDSTQST